MCNDCILGNILQTGNCFYFMRLLCPSGNMVCCIASTQKNYRLVWFCHLDDCTHTQCNRPCSRKNSLCKGSARDRSNCSLQNITHNTFIAHKYLQDIYTRLLKIYHKIIEYTSEDFEHTSEDFKHTSEDFEHTSQDFEQTYITRS